MLLFLFLCFVFALTFFVTLCSFYLAEPVQFKYEANFKGKITLQCKLENIPNDINKTVTWCRRHRYNGTKQILDVRTERSSQTSLEIESCEAKDSGFYSCMVRYGRKEISSKEIELCVYGRKFQSNDIHGKQHIFVN